MSTKDWPPGCDSWGPADQPLARRGSVVMVGHGDIAAWVPRFGQPSSYSLTHAELTAEVRRRRRDGWQHWEIAARFDFGTATRAA